MRLLVTTGLADPSDPDILVQLSTKHPDGKESMPADISSFGPFSELKIDLTHTFKQLDCFSGSGRSGFRNSNTVFESTYR